MRPRVVPPAPVPGAALLGRRAVLAAGDRRRPRADLVDEGERPGAAHDDGVAGAQRLGSAALRDDPATAPEDGAQRQRRAVDEVQGPGRDQRRAAEQRALRPHPADHVAERVHAPQVRRMHRRSGASPMATSTDAALTRRHEHGHHPRPRRHRQDRPAGRRPPATARRAGARRLAFQRDPIRLVRPRRLVRRHQLGHGPAGRHRDLRRAAVGAGARARVRRAGGGRRRAAPGPALRARRRHVGRLGLRARHALGRGRRARLGAGLDRAAVGQLRAELRRGALARPAARRRAGPPGRARRGAVHRPRGRRRRRGRGAHRARAPRRAYRTSSPGHARSPSARPST